MRVLLFCALSLAIVAAQTSARQTAAQLPTRDRAIRPRPAPETPEPKLANVTLAGRVVADGLNAGAPLTKVRVELTGDSRTTDWMFTDSTGAFEFSGLPAGRYGLLADKTGFAPATSSIDLAEGAHENVEIRMQKGAVIAGRIVDDLGEPVVGARVTVNAIRFEGRARRLEAISRVPAESDDLGAFRIGGFPAGSYLLSVIAPPRGPAAFVDFTGLATTPPVRVGVGRMFYPASTTSEGAVPIELNAGEERLDVDITLTPLRPAALSLAVSSAPDPALRGATSAAEAIQLGVDRAVLQSIQQVNVSFASADSPELEGRGIAVTGAYGFNPNLTPPAVAIDPGSWAVVARKGLDGGILHLTLGPGETQSAALSIRPASQFSGRVIFQGSARRPAPSSVHLDVAGAGPDGGLSPLLLAPGGPFAVKPDGAFAIAGTIGTVEFLVAAPPGWAVSQFTAGDRDLLGTPITFEGGETVTNARVVLTDQVAEITGTVVGADIQPAAGCAVAAFPADTGVPFNRYRMGLAKTDRGGRFTLSGLPAGSYIVAAARDLKEASWTAPDSLDRLRLAGTPVTIVEREKKTVSLSCGGLR